MRVSPGSVGDCHDNAVAQIFFATRKGGFLHRTSWPTRAAGRAAILDFVQAWYDRRRRHSTPAYRSLDAVEALHRR